LATLSEFFEKNGIYRCVHFDDFEWQNHGFGSRQANPAANITLRQVHSDLVWNAQGLRDREYEGDALISAVPGHAIGVRTADCVPILLLDPLNRAVAAVHAGWRGSAARILERTVSKLYEDFKTNPVQLRAAIGPAIRVCCYEVTSDVADRFIDWPESIHSTFGKPHLDLPAANRIQLIRSGVLPHHIYDSGLCTSCNLDRFFSFRREPANPGRMVSAIARV